MCDRDTNGKSRESGLGRIYDIPYFSMDVISRVIPGFVFLALLAIFVADHEHVRGIARQINEAQGWLCGLLVAAAIVVVSYLLGLLADCLSWVITERAARFWHRRRWHTRLNQGGAHWSVELWRKDRERVDMKAWKCADALMLEKAQVESKAFANAAILLCLLFLPGLVLYWWFGTRSLAHTELSPGGCIVAWVLIGLAMVLFLVASVVRQRRRIMAVIVIANWLEQRDGKPSSPDGREK